MTDVDEIRIPVVIDDAMVDPGLANAERRVKGREKVMRERAGDAVRPGFVGAGIGGAVGGAVGGFAGSIAGGAVNTILSPIIELGIGLLVAMMLPLLDALLPVMEDVQDVLLKLSGLLDKPIGEAKNVIESAQDSAGKALGANPAAVTPKDLAQNVGTFGLTGMAVGAAAGSTLGGVGAGPGALIGGAVGVVGGVGATAISGFQNGFDNWFWQDDDSKRGTDPDFGTSVSDERVRQNTDHGATG